MTMRRIVLGTVILLVGLAYLGGYLPEHRRRVSLESDVAALQTQLEDATGRVRAAELLGRLLRVNEVVAAMNFAEARTLSTAFFDEVRAEVARTPVAALRSPLQQILQRRDAVTAALSRGDGSVVELIRQMQVEIRTGLAYPVTPAPSVG